MASYEYDSVTELEGAYGADLEADHDEEWWAAAEYLVSSEEFTLTFAPRPDKGHWHVRVVDDSGETVRKVAGDKPTAEAAGGEIAALLRQARRARHPERERVMEQLRELAHRRREVDGEFRKLAVRAVKHGVKKVLVADTARVSRVTLDKWLRDL